MVTLDLKDSDSLSRAYQVLGVEWTLDLQVVDDFVRRWPVDMGLCGTRLTSGYQVISLPLMSLKLWHSLYASLIGWSCIFAFKNSSDLITKLKRSKA